MWFPRTNSVCELLLKGGGEKEHETEKMKTFWDVPFSF